MSNDKQLVHSENTNPYENISNKIELVGRLSTNYPLLFEYNTRGELVHYLANNILSGIEGQILRYIDQNPVFLVPTMINALNIKKAWAYDVVQKLKEFEAVIRTNYKINPPDSRYAGPKPRIHILAYVELSGISDPKIRDARKRYFELFRQTDFGVAQTSLNADISQLVIEDYHSRRMYAQFTPSLIEIIKFLKSSVHGKNIDPRDRRDYAKKVYDRLIKLKWGEDL